MYLSIEAQSAFFGLPLIRNFPRSEYGGGMQSWSFSETDNGLLYFANNLGMLEYNGNHWSLYNSVKAVNRVVCADSDRIYVGAFNEFGFYEENDQGILVYKSLSDSIKNSIKDFDEIWRIHKTDSGIVFQSFKAIFIYRNGKIDRVSPISAFHFSYFVNGHLWVYDEQKGLMQCREGQVVAVPGGDYFAGLQIWSMFPLNEREIIIGTSKKGLFRYDGNKVVPWTTEINEYVKKYQLYSGKRLINNYFAFGTVQDGLFVTDTSGNLVFQMNKERGLQNNTVLSIGQDIFGNIWLCLDNGISMIEFDSPISFFRNYYDIGTLYASAVFGDNIYLGSNQGLFYINIKEFTNPSKTRLSFKMIEGTDGQVWNLSVIDNALFCGHNNGVFQVQGNTAVQISTLPGAWNFLKINHKPFILVGSFNGLSILENRQGVWHFRNSIHDFNESSRFVQCDQSGNIWVSQTYKGMFRIKSDSTWQNVLDLRFFNSNDGLPANQSNVLFRIGSEIKVATEKGIYKFNENSQTFERDLVFSSYFDQDIQVDYIYQDSEKNLWYSAGKTIGVLRFQEDGSYKKISTPFLILNNYTLRSFENIRELDQNNVIIGLEGGFAVYNSKYFKDYTQPCTIYISEFKSADTSEGIFRYDSRKPGQKSVPYFKYRNNSVSVSFSANCPESGEMGFQYRLVGFDDDWSQWTNQHFKEYTNLPDGHYTFLLRARNNELATPSELSFKFVISPPWYRSVLAWIIYLVLIVFFIYLGRRYLNYRVEKSRYIEYLKQNEKFLKCEQKLKEESLLAEKEMQSLRNESLKLEMIHKEKELANSTMLIIRKNDILNKLQNDLRTISATTVNDLEKNKINNLIRRINKEIDNEKQWKVFNSHIEQVYEEMFRKLRANYPDLTPRELSLCAYLRMNMSSKEIATIMNISARGVEIGRYRLRRKLRLDRETNLTEFMLSL